MRTLIVFLAICLGRPMTASAQDSVSLPVASRVRITFNEAGQSRELTGNLLALKRDSILFSPGRQALSLDRVIRLEVSAGQQRHPFAGMFIGAAVGAIALGTGAALSASHNRGSFSGVRQEYTPSVMAVYGGILGASAGASVGLVIGSFKIYEGWKPVTIR